MKVWLPLLCLGVSMASAQDIYEYHKDFKTLISEGEKLLEIRKSINPKDPLLDQQVELFAAAELRSSADLLYTSTSLILHQHASLVDVFTNTGYFNDTNLRKSVQLLLKQCHWVLKRCRRYKETVRSPSIFQPILELEKAVINIEMALEKYRVVELKTEPDPARQSPK